MIAFESNFAKSEGPIFLTAPKRKMWRWSCGNWRKLSPDRNRNRSSSREIFAAESGSLARVRRSIASARPGLSANSSIRKQDSFLDAKRAPNRRVLTFDMLDGDFSHDGEDCTFETLIRRFGIQDKAARKIAEMVHDADLDDDKFQRSECIGIDRVLKGWAKRRHCPTRKFCGADFECFDALYTFLQRR